MEKLYFVIQVDNFKRGVRQVAIRFASDFYFNDYINGKTIFILYEKIILRNKSGHP